MKTVSRSQQVTTCIVAIIVAHLFPITLLAQETKTRDSDRGVDANSHKADLKDETNQRPQLVVQAGHSGGVLAVAFSLDGKYVLTGSGDKTARLSEIETGRELRKFGGHSGIVKTVAFSPDGKYVLTSSDNTAQLWETETGRGVRRFIGHLGFVDSVVFSPDGKYVLTGSHDNTARLWETETGRAVRQFIGHSGWVISAVFLADGKHVLTGSWDSTSRLWDIATGREICSLVWFQNGVQVVVAPDGRFDASNLEEIKGLHWVMPDDPMRAYPLEIFMRDYYEPRLWPRLLNGEKFETSPVSQLNRTQPPVKIVGIERQRDKSDLVTVTIEVAKEKSERQRDEKGNLRETGVYDIRLFRDGQIVGQYADGKPQALPPSASNEEKLNAWRNEAQIKLDADGKRTIKFENIKLPRKADLKQVEFSAYAFNEDRVISKADRKTFDIPADLTPLKGHAYLITIGVNAYQNPDLDLRFAANDARRIQTTLVDRLAKSNLHNDIVQIPLISDYEIKSHKHVLTEKSGEALATKTNFKTVLDLLAGRKVDDKLKAKIPNADRIRQARPEDMIIISFASHGYADNTGSGNFYFIPYDTGKLRGKQVSDELLSHAISSEELSLWLRDVDAGEMAMIVDACQSAAAVGTEFKPGPMGSRGLGQLSYDKGMRILTATQADNVALENNKLEQGLLTYALIRDGLEAGKAFSLDHTSITLTEWLKYGEKRVPDLYDDVKSGKLRLLLLSDAKETPSTASKVQKPSLFDFARKRRGEVLFTKN